VLEDSGEANDTLSVARPDAAAPEQPEPSTGSNAGAGRGASGPRLRVGQIARRLGVTPTTVGYHARKLGIPPSRKYAPRGDWAEIQRFYDAGHSVRECQDRFGFWRRSWNKAVIRGDVIPRPQAIPIEELLVAGPERNRTHVKLRLLSAGVKENRCEECGISEWLDEPLSMTLHHVNGDGEDNRVLISGRDAIHACSAARTCR
jgi:hypothetical protein